MAESKGIHPPQDGLEALRALSEKVPEGHFFVDEDGSRIRVGKMQVTVAESNPHHGKNWGTSKDHAQFLAAAANHVRAALASTPNQPGAAGGRGKWPASYQETFDAIGKAVRAHPGGALSISVKAFYRALAYPDSPSAPAQPPAPEPEPVLTRTVSDVTESVDDVLRSAINYALVAPDGLEWLRAWSEGDPNAEVERLGLAKLAKAPRP